jgi:hypothetical protein
MDMDLAFSCSMAALTARVENGNEWKLGEKKQEEKGVVVSKGEALVFDVDVSSEGGV